MTVAAKIISAVVPILALPRAGMPREIMPLVTAAAVTAASPMYRLRRLNPPFSLAVVAVGVDLPGVAGVLVGGMVCVRYLRSAIADDIWDYLGKRSAYKSRVQLEQARNDGIRELIPLLKPGMVLTEGGPDWHREIRVPEPQPPLPADERGRAADHDECKSDTFP